MDTTLVELFRHSLWANLRLLEACSDLTEKQLDASVPLVQAIHHASEHRTQVLTILSQQGIEPPDLSGWAFGDAMGY